jgi:pimeloyl-ACP methyl ester carboxylesterase
MPNFESFDGVSLFYTDEGDGRTVVLLHGFAADSNVNYVRSGVLDLLLDEGYRVIALDARGHGLSDKPTDVESYANDAMRHDVAALFDHLGLDDVVLVGYSMGAELAMRFTGSDERVAALVIVGVGATEDDFAVREERRQRFIAAFESESDDEAAELLGGFRLMAGLDRTPLLAQLKSGDSRGERPVSIAVPMILVVGDDDTVAGDPVPLAARYGAPLVQVPGSHFNAHASPQAHAALLGFLREQ